MRAVDILRAKRDGHELTPAQIQSFVRGATVKDWEDYQLTAMLMAIFWRGMSPTETAELTRAMTDSGKRLNHADLPGPKVDKHSTGGVGDKTSLVLAPLAAACGAYVPMMSGRGLGHTGGTLDKLEAIPGFRVNLSEAEFKTTLRATRIGMIGQTADVAPADKTLYALRDVTATVECIPLITASILSKKLAEGIDALVLDVKCGSGGFMKNRQDARALARSLVTVATANGLRCEAVITAMDHPLGREIGNANEVAECIETLKGRGPKDLTDLSVHLAARMVAMAGLTNNLSSAEDMVRTKLHQGDGVEFFRKMVAAQGGNPAVVDTPELLPQAPERVVVKATATGTIATMDAEKVGVAGMLLGAGRKKAQDSVDHAVGISLKKTVGEKVYVGDVVYEVHYRTEDTLDTCLDLLNGSYSMSANPSEPPPLILEEVLA